MTDELAPKNVPFHRFLSLMRKLGALSLFVETPESSHEEAQDNDAIAVRCQCNVRDLNSKTTRVSFFRRRLLSAQDLERLDDEDFLGYCVLRSVWLPKENRRRTWVYEAVARWTPLLNNYLHCCSVFRCTVGQNEFRVKGSYFAQQNNLTYVCFHSALKMALKHMGGVLDQEKSYRDINAALRINHKGDNAVGTYADHSPGGVDYGNIEEVFDSLAVRLAPIDYSFDPGEPPGSNHLTATNLVYPYVESGFPALLFFKGSGGVEGHVITAVGHTFNSDSWAPMAEKGYGIPDLASYSTSSWADHLVVHDDNFGMYMCLGRDCLSPWGPTPDLASDENATSAERPAQAEFAPLHVVSFVPESICRQPSNAEAVSSALLQGWFSADEGPTDPWNERLRQAFREQDEPPVFRTFLSSKSLYLRHLGSIRDWEGACVDGNFIAALRSVLPEHFWITEIALRDLYTGNHRKLGEVVSDATTGNIEDRAKYDESWLALRLPGLGVLRSGEDDFPSAFGLQLQGHTELLRLLSPRPPEW